MLLVLAVLISLTVAKWEIGMLVKPLSFSPWSKIPTVHSCSKSGYPVSFPYGKNLNPGYSWNKPASDNNATKSYALILHDPGSGFPFLHWGVMNIPHNTTTIREGQSTNKILPTGSWEIYNIMTGYAGYHGICPPTGYLHIYRALVLARDQEDLQSNFPKKFTHTANGQDVITHLLTDGHTLAVAEVGGVFP